MQFNYYFDIASIFLYIVILLLYGMQNFVKNKAYYIFLLLWLVSFLTPFADIASVKAMDYSMPLLFAASNEIYYLGQQLSAYLFFLYIISPLVRRDGIRIDQYIGYSTPLGIAVVLIISNPWTEVLYNYNFATGEYTYGSLQPLCYICALFYYVYSLYYTISRKDMYNNHVRYAIYNTAFIIFGFIIYSAIVPYMLTKSFSIALSLIQILIVTIDQHATFNADTGLLSKMAFYECINNLTYNKVPFRVVCIRLADYEVILSTYGLEKLTELEIKICEGLSGIIPRNRGFKLHDDVICMIFERQDTVDNKEIEQKVDAILQEKYTIDDVDISFSHFVTTFSYPSNFSSKQELMSLVIYLRKTRRMRYGIISVEEFGLRNLHREQDVEKAMLHALQNNEFEMFYQPIYSTEKKTFATAEGLIRLNHSIIGPIGPNEFIPIAERCGLIVPIGDYVLEATCKYIANHDLKSLGIDYLEINLSTIQCLQRNFIDHLFSLVEKYKVDPKMICFEITETASNCSPEIFHQNLQQLKAAGFKLAIDDFGTGYGNLTRLLSMDFDIVKFDRATTETICTDDKVRPLYARMITMLHSLGCKVVAEGVETKEQLDFLTKMGTDYIQGYYFSIPVDEDRFINFMEEKA